MAAVGSSRTEGLITPAIYSPAALVSAAKVAREAARDVCASWLLISHQLIDSFMQRVNARLRRTNVAIRVIIHFGG